VFWKAAINHSPSLPRTTVQVCALLSLLSAGRLPLYTVAAGVHDGGGGAVEPGLHDYFGEPGGLEELAKDQANGTHDVRRAVGADLPDQRPHYPPHRSPGADRACPPRLAADDRRKLIVEPVGQPGELYFARVTKAFQQAIEDIAR
jgi:hypothetical protein